MSKKYLLGWYILLFIAFFYGMGVDGIVYAAEPAGEYLQYQEPKPASYSSGFSTLASNVGIRACVGLSWENVANVKVTFLGFCVIFVPTLKSYVNFSVDVALVVPVLEYSSPNIVVKSPLLLSRSLAR